MSRHIQDSSLAVIAQAGATPRHRSASDILDPFLPDFDGNNEEEATPDYTPQKVDTSLIPNRIGRYDLRGSIGEGSFSVVKLAYALDEKRFYACKVVQRERLERSHLESRFDAEIRIHQQLHHPGIIELSDILKDDIFYYVFLEFCPGGELFHYIVDRGRLTEESAKPILKQFMNAIDYLHSLGIAHRDLKPENLLLDQFAHVKLSDFGLSRFLDERGLSHTPCGSPCYASPECLSGKPYDGRKSDIWSCGVILFAMVTGQLPWTKRNQNQLFEQIKRGEYLIPPFLSTECGDLLRKMMEVDCSKRLSAKQVLDHSFLNDIQIEKDQKLSHLISLKRVDEFFNKNDSYVKIKPFDIPRTLSNTPQSFEEETKLLQTRYRRRSSLNRPKVVVIQKIMMPITGTRPIGIPKPPKNK